MKKALLAVSFGTSVPKAREGIAAVEAALKAQAPELDFYRAFTSPKIRAIWEKRGESIPDLAGALERLGALSYEQVFVQPTHLLYGFEYDKVKETTECFAGSFSRLVLGKPLLSESEDLLRLAAEAQAYPRQAGEALVWLGHGTNHFANMVYPALQTALHLAHIEGVFVGTVEGWPTFEDVLSELRASGCRSVLLAPLMLVAGDHALNDMAGDAPESWKSRLEVEGFSVCCAMEGLGLHPGIQNLYRDHLKALVEPYGV